jgi:Photosynthesis system II assembly factor YCF48
MTEVPKIVHDRLRQQAASVPAHPDADLLAAFAEQALSATERESVLGHLALCGDCREVVTLALPAADAVASPNATEAAGLQTNGLRSTDSRTESPKPRRLIFAWPVFAWPVFAWPNLRWAALAAGIALAASVLLLHPRKQNVATSPSEASQATTYAPPASPAQVAESPTDQPATLARNDAPKLKSELQPSNKPSAGKAAAVGTSSGMMLADARTKKDDKDKDGGAFDSRPATPTAAARALNAPLTHATSETVEASGANAAAPAPAAEAGSMARNEDALVARNEATASETRVMKAKPAPLAAEANSTEKELQKTQGAAFGVPPPAKPQPGNVAYANKLASPAAQMPVRKINVTWAIVAGVLQRSTDSGQSWQSVIRADHLLLCYATNDQEVWTGGQAGTIFHSSDGGTTWIQLQPSVKGQTLTSDVTHIELHGAGEITLSTSNGETWSSSDNGKEWNKK